MTDQQFFDFCQVNSHLRIEKDRFGHLSIMSAIDEKMANLSGSIFEQLRVWSQQHHAGIIFDAKTRFKLSTGANRLPYAAWMKLDRWNTFSSAPKEWFIPTCPDFVVEIRFINQNLQLIQENMAEYMQESEIKLGWLIDLQHRQVYTALCETNWYSSSSEKNSFEVADWSIKVLQELRVVRRQIYYVEKTF
ncbi:Uma2 family endonuclease [Nostoc piscinale]|uniref:Uma2 family endonuclease n=1 Tax=Nostoc piscinale TaxID=224012 RepID=UPI001F226933|nr:Uma2 family endonuclease [Nostoc piscinale]